MALTKKDEGTAKEPTPDMVRAPFFKEEQDMDAQEIKETSKKYVLQTWSNCVQTSGGFCI